MNRFRLLVPQARALPLDSGTDDMNPVPRMRASGKKSAGRKGMRSARSPRDILLRTFPKDGIGAEIGVHLGEFSKRILQVARPKKLFLIDPWRVFEDSEYDESWYGSGVTQDTMDERYRHVGNMFSRQISMGRVSLVRELSGEAAARFPDNYFDFIYLDGDHTYNGVTTDLESYLPKVKSEGIIAGDDYAYGHWWGDGVIRAFNELIGSGRVRVEFKMDRQIALRKL